MKALWILAPLSLLPVCSVFGQSADAREHIWGTWKTGSETWELSPADSGKVHIKQVENGANRIDFTCDTVGTECKTKVGGKNARFSMYFNGSTLVQWEHLGKETVRRRFKPADDGSSLQIESEPMSPPGKPETLKLARSGGTQDAERARQDSQGQIERK